MYAPADYKHIYRRPIVETKDKEEQINDEMDPSVIDYVNKFIQRQSKRYIWKY